MPGHQSPPGEDATAGDTDSAETDSRPSDQTGYTLLNPITNTSSYCSSLTNGHCTIVTPAVYIGGETPYVIHPDHRTLTQVPSSPPSLSPPPPTPTTPPAPSSTTAPAAPSPARQLEQRLGDDLVDHPAAEVWHVLLGEGEPGVAGQVLGELAGEHAAVGAVHLLRDLLRRTRTDGQSTADTDRRSQQRTDGHSTADTDRRSQQRTDGHSSGQTVTALPTRTHGHSSGQTVTALPTRHVGRRFNRHPGTSSSRYAGLCLPKFIGHPHAYNCFRVHNMSVIPCIHRFRPNK